MNEFEKTAEFCREQAQKYADKLSAALNPIDDRSTPFILHALRGFTKALETTMDEEQKKAADLLPLMLESLAAVHINNKGGEN